MKRSILLLTITLICCVSYAQQESGSISINKDSLSWKSSQIIQYNDTVLIDFGQNEKIILKTSCNGIPRKELSSLLVADKKIFVQVGKVALAYNEAGMLVDKNDGKDLKTARVIIAANELPLKLTYKGDTISVIQFEPSNESFCEMVRKQSGAYNIPPRDSIKIGFDEFKTFKYTIPDIKMSDQWKAKKQFYINQQEIIGSTAQINVGELCPNIECNSQITISYTIDFANDFFSHKRSGNLAYIFVGEKRPSGFITWEWWSWSYLWYLILLTAIIIVLFYLKTKTKVFKNREHNRIIKRHQEYIDEVMNKKGSEEKICIIIKLLSNEDIEFKEKIAQVSNIEKNNSETSNLSEKITQLQKEKSLIEGERDKLKEEKESLILQVNNLSRDNQVFQERISALVETVNRLRLEINEFKSRVSRKDSLIEQLSKKIQVLNEQFARISRQNMYVHQIDDALKDISESIIKAFSSVPEGELNKKLVVPLLNGVAGLDEGMMAYYSQWQNQVIFRQHDFFGKDLYDMSDDEVKKRLVSGFLKTIAQGDTFSKLTRLYMYIQVDWINSILITNGFNVNEVERLFNRLKLLFDDFGIEIVYPRLFVDHMNEQKFSFDPRCEVFKLFPVNEELRASISKQHDLIIDIIQIGIIIPSEQYSRKAIVSISSF